MNNKNFKITALLLSVFLIGSLMTSQQTLSQDKILPPQPQNYYSLNLDPVHPILSETPMQVKELSEHEKDLIKQIDEARINNNVPLKEKLEREYYEKNGASMIQGSRNNLNLPVPINSYSSGHNQSGEQDYMIYPVNTGSDPWSVSTCTTPTGAPNAGRIWVAYTAFSGTATDTFHIAYSDNGGSSWTQYNSFNYASSNIKFRSSELKIIPVYDGTNFYVFGVVGLTYLSNNYSAFFRYNITGSTFFYGYIQSPGSGFSYNPRIATDNTIYSSNAYVFTISSFDSLYAGGHYVFQKFMDCLNPFAASPTFTYINTSGSGFGWVLSGGGSGIYLSSDIAYYQDAGNNRIMVLYALDYGGGIGAYDMYLAWVDNYGSTLTGNIVVSESNSSRGGRMAFNGGAANRNGMITYLRQFSGADWDVAYRNTTTGGTTGGAWNMGYVDISGFHASGYPDIVAIRSGANLFKVGYNEDSATTAGSGSRGMFAGFNGTTWSAPSYLDISGVGTDSTYTRVSPGYKLGGGDDGLAFFSKVGGTGDIGIYCSNQIVTTIGFGNNNNDVPHEYSLSQNYPNPFNPATEIKYGIPQSGLVKLVIYDVLGQEVASLVNEVKQAGEYSISFNASNIPSGVYFYKLTAGVYSNVKKMMLVK